ncbi:hypothetical protein [Streptomyces sp. NPDC059894]|uniref:hypothetical protein n=1 Tax=unclassified Streptomyces TaxID=2593676 RepID=UPI0036494D2D
MGEHLPDSRLGWSGIGAGVQLYQAWLLKPVEADTHVVIENVVRGPGAHCLDALSPVWAQHVNSPWLEQLERLSENAPEETGRP